MVPLGVTQQQLAEKMGIPVQRVNLIINGHQGIAAETALLLAKVFKTTSQFWLNGHRFSAARRARHQLSD